MQPLKCCIFVAKFDPYNSRFLAIVFLFWLRLYRLFQFFLSFFKWYLILLENTSLKVKILTLRDRATKIHHLKSIFEENFSKEKHLSISVHRFEAVLMEMKILKAAFYYWGIYVFPFFMFVIIHFDVYL